MALLPQATAPRYQRSRREESAGEQLFMPMSMAAIRYLSLLFIVTRTGMFRQVSVKDLSRCRCLCLRTTGDYAMIRCFVVDDVIRYKQKIR